MARRSGITRESAAGECHRDSFVDVMTNSMQYIAGMAMTTKLLSEQPSAHLESLIIDPALRKRGMCNALMQQVEETVHIRRANSNANAPHLQKLPERVQTKPKSQF